LSITVPLCLFIRYLGTRSCLRVCTVVFSWGADRTRERIFTPCTIDRSRLELKSCTILNNWLEPLIFG
ncbi:hypothetical protein QT971_16435, partial [Microcoleus sp. herbarium19]|uniref:hypothetical protein n=1 Tax=unclassified Microcoleus TaxID=2642155 RepID=UPI002FD5F377